MEMESKKKTVNGLWLLAVLIYISFSLLLSVISQLAGSMWSGVILQVILLAVCIIIMGRQGYRLQELFPLRRIQLKDIGSLILLAALCEVITQFAAEISLLFFSNSTAGMIARVSAHPLSALLQLALCPALCEEMLFRGVMYQGILRESGNRHTAILVSALMFAMMHMNFNQMTYALAAGILFAMIMDATGNLLFTMIIHLFINGLSLAETFIHVRLPAFLSYSGEPAVSHILRLGAAAMVSGVLFVRILAFLRKDRLAQISRQGESSSDKAGIQVNVDKKDGENEKEEKKGCSGWKPDIYFITGSLICIVIAGLSEIN